MSGHGGGAHAGGAHGGGEHGGGEHGGAHGAAEVAVDVGAVVGLVLVVLLLVGYLAGAARLRTHGPRGWSGWRTASFTVGALLVGAALVPWPAGVLGGGARAHMAQHLLLGMAAPLALVLGAPVRVLLGAVPRARRPVARVLRTPALHVVSHPGVAALLHVGGLWVLYLTPLYAWSLAEPAVHHAVRLHFVAAGSLFAWALVGPDPAPGRPSLRVRAVVLVVAAAAHGVLAKLLYARAPALPPGAPHGVAETEQAAQWMYYGGDIAEVLLVVALCTQWYRRGARAGAHPAGTVTWPRASAGRRERTSGLTARGVTRAAGRP